MDQQQFDIACQIIALDCTLVGGLKDGNGNFCAVGGLYTAIDPDWAVDKELYRDGIYTRVAEAFDIVHIDHIWRASDEGDADEFIEDRRARVIEALRLQLDADPI